MNKVFRLSTFRRKMGYARITKDFKDKLAFLEKEGVVVIQQSGFLAHSLRHPIIVVIKDEMKTLSVFSKTKIKKQLKEQQIQKLGKLEKRIKKLEWFRVWFIAILKDIFNYFYFGLAVCPHCRHVFKIEKMFDGS